MAGLAAASRSETGRSTSDSSTASSSRSTRRPGRSSGRRRSARSPGGLHDHRERRSLTTAASTLGSRAVNSVSAGASRPWTPRQARCSGASTPSRGRGEPGHETWPSNNDAWKHGSAPVWQTPAVDPEARAPLLLDRVTPRPDFIRCGEACRRQPLLGHRSSPLTRRRGSTAGTSRKSTTTSGTTTRPARSCSSTVSVGGRERHGDCAGRQDRLGVHPRPGDGQAADRDRREVRAADAAQFTSPTQPFPRGDADRRAVGSSPKAFARVPKTLPEGNEASSNGGRIFTPYSPGTTSVVARRARSGAPTGGR